VGFDSDVCNEDAGEEPPQAASVRERDTRRTNAIPIFLIFFIIDSSFFIGVCR
jgi:hypothetical protein